MRCIIVGGGIAGSVAALSLQREGIETIVLEQVSEKKEVGAGIQLSSNGVKVLAALGLEPKLSERAVAAERISFKDLDRGDALFETPLGERSAERYGAYFYQAHRADLLDMVARALPPEVVRLNAKCVAFDQDETQATAILASGERISGDVVIGADGIHSAVREHLFGKQEPKFSGTLMWRALISGEQVARFDLEPYLHVWSGPSRSAVAYWVRPGELLNFVGMVPAVEVHRESWDQGGNVADLRASFEGVEPQLAGIVDAVETTFITGLFYHQPLDRWTDRRISLMGDAAHAMAPNLAQGACQSIEDAWVLAQSIIRGRDDAPGALRDYELRRRPRCTKVQSAARAMLSVLQEDDPVQIKARNGRFKGIARIDPLSETVWGWLYDYDALRAVDTPLDQMRGITAAFEGMKMERPESQRAFEMWRDAFTAENVAQGLPGMRAGYDRFFERNFDIPEDCVEMRSADGSVKGIWVGAGPADGPVVLFFHGGGYVLGSVRTELDLAARIAASVGGRALVLDYRLAPEHPFPAAFEDALAGFDWLLEEGIPASRVVFAGEGAGAGLALAASLALRDAGKDQPAAIVALSPWTDLTIAGSSVQALDGRDPVSDRERLVYLAASYFQAADPLDPSISPLFGDLTGLAPLIVQSAEGEVLSSDTTRFVDSARAAGVDVQSDLYPDTVHVFPLFSFLPETTIALERIGAFVGRHLS